MQTTPLSSHSIAIDTATGYHKKTLTGVLEGQDDRHLSQDEQPETGVISILLVDDHGLMREGIRQLLELEEDLHVIAEATHGYEALHKVRKLLPDVVLMDISLPGVDGLAITRQITNEFPDIAGIMLTVARKQEQVLQAIRNGAKGYLLKSVSSRELVQAIRTVHAGGVLIEPELTGALVNEYRRLSELHPLGSSLTALTEKEIELLRYVATGLSNKEIADKLAYSEKTVKNYLSIIFQKLNIRDRTQAAIFAFRQGLLPDEDCA